MNREKKKQISFVTIFLIIFSVAFNYLFLTSYAKYRKQTLSTVDGNFAGWIIKINNETISGKTVMTNKITPVFDKNEYIKEGIIAPGATGYFDLVIDASLVDVNFNFDLDFVNSDLNTIPDLIITDYELNDSGTKVAFNSEKRLTKDVNKNTSKTKIRIYFHWNDDSNTEIMNNEEDTAISGNPDKNANIKVRIKFTQKEN